MPLFGKRPVQARVTGVTWSRVVQLERQEWVPKRSSWVPSDDVRNVEKHTESYVAAVNDMQPGMPGSGAIPGTPGSFPGTLGSFPGTPGAGGFPATPGSGGFPATPAPSTRLEPRIRVYYTYEQLEWHKGAELKAWGTGQDGVTWPEYELGPHERVRDRSETYAATFAAGDKSYEATFSEQEWRALEPGVSCRLTLGLFGGVKAATPTVG